MKLTTRLNGIFFTPQETLRQIAERPLWVDILIFLLIAWMIYTYLISPFSQKDSIALMRDNVRLKELMGEERYQARLKQLENPSSRTKLLNVFLIYPAMLTFGLLISSAILLIFGRFLSSEGKFIQVFACVLHANLIDKLLGNAVRLVLISLKKSVFQTSTSLALLFPQLSYASPAYVILSQVDFFQLWLFGVLAYGLAAAFKISTRRAFFLSYGFWLLKSLLSIGLGLLNLRYLS